MKRVSPGLAVNEQECSECGATYTANYILSTGKPHDMSGGMCRECRDKLIREREAKEEAERLADVARRRRQWRERSGIPSRFMYKEFGNFEIDRQPTAYKRALQYAEKYPLGKATGYPSLLLTSEGVWGVGKTHLACAIIHHILNKWNGENIIMPCYFTTEPDLFRSIQATYNYSNDDRRIRETEEDIYNRLIHVPLLVIDDIGKEQRGDARFVQRVLFAIIDGRYSRNLPMVLTTNLSPELLEQHLGGVGSNEASMDRLVEMTNGKFVRLKGESYRRKE